MIPLITGDLPGHADEPYGQQAHHPLQHGTVVVKRLSSEYRPGADALNRHTGRSAQRYRVQGTCSTLTAFGTLLPMVTRIGSLSFPVPVYFTRPSMVISCS